MICAPLTEAYLEAATQLWTVGWRDGHLGLTPDALVKQRTAESFRTRLWDHRADTVLALQEGGRLAGFYIHDADQLYQFYVAGAARGTGLAGQLIAAAEQKIATKGHAVAWLDCTVGNERAAAFYSKSGWRNTGVRTVGVYTEDGPFAMDVWRFEKTVG